MSHAPVSFKVGGALSAYRIVRVSAANTVAACSATTDLIAGVSADEASASGQSVPVAVGGIAKVYANDTIAAGAFIMSDAQGRGIPAVVNTAGVYVLGICLNTVSATGTLAEVLVNPFQVSVP